VPGRPVMTADSGTAADAGAAHATSAMAIAEASAYIRPRAEGRRSDGPRRGATSPDFARSVGSWSEASVAMKLLVRIPTLRSRPRTGHPVRRGLIP
jgi:hypothetical protein